MLWTTVNTDVHKDLRNCESYAANEISTFYLTRRTVYFTQAVYWPYEAVSWDGSCQSTHVQDCTSADHRTCPPHHSQCYRPFHLDKPATHTEDVHITEQTGLRLRQIYVMSSTRLTPRRESTCHQHRLPWWRCKSCNGTLKNRELKDVFVTIFKISPKLQAPLRFTITHTHSKLHVHVSFVVFAQPDTQTYWQTKNIPFIQWRWCTDNQQLLYQSDSVVKTRWKPSCTISVFSAVPSDSSAKIYARHLKRKVTNCLKERCLNGHLKQDNEPNEWVNRV